MPSLTDSQRPLNFSPKQTDAALGFGLKFAVSSDEIETFTRSQHPPKKPNFEAIPQSTWKWGPNPRAAPPIMQIQPSPSSAAQKCGS